MKKRYILAKILIMKNIIFLFVLSILFISCDTESIDPALLSDIENGNIDGGGNNNGGGSTGLLLKEMMISHSDPDFEFYNSTHKYTYNGNKINKIQITDGNFTDEYRFFYSGNLVTKIEFWEEGILEEIYEYTYNSNGKLIKAKDLIYGESSYTYTDFIYLANNMVEIKEYLFSNGNAVLNQIDYAKIVNNRVEQITYPDGITYIYEYDNRNNPLKNVVGCEQIFNLPNGFHGDFNLTIGGANNLTKIYATTNPFLYYSETRTHIVYNNFPVDSSINVSFGSNSGLNPETVNIFYTYY